MGSVLQCSLLLTIGECVRGGEGERERGGRGREG